MHLNEYAEGTTPLDMTELDEFRSLLASAADLSIPHSREVRYRSHNIVLRHQRFHYLEWGDPGAQPVVLLHGGHQSAHSWDLVSLHLADRYRVLALDQRGHGDSEWARDGDYCNYTMSLDARAFIETLGLDRPLVMGHSMGGRNSMLMEKHAPGLMRALVIVDVGPETAEPGRRAIGKFIKANEVFDDLEHFVENVRKYDPYRPREHIERTVRYNMLERADGKYISKCDYRRWRGEIGTVDTSRDDVSLDEAARFDLLGKSARLSDDFEPSQVIVTGWWSGRPVDAKGVSVLVEVVGENGRILGHDVYPGAAPFLTAPASTGDGFIRDLYLPLSTEPAEDEQLEVRLTAFREDAVLVLDPLGTTMLDSRGKVAIGEWRFAVERN